MNTRYTSKYSVVLTVLVWAPFLMTLALVSTRSHWILFVLIPAIGFVAWIWFGTYCMITDTTLETRCGPFRESIPLASITKVSASHSLMSGAALSLDRISIIHGRFGEETLISPHLRQEFINELATRCPQAKIDVV
jgi:hypothetical protein